MRFVAKGKVLVTGANGYLATWIIHALLEEGYSVRAAVRSVSKGTHLLKTFSAYGNKLELSNVPDMVESGAFDEAVKGVDAIEHTASPVHLDADDPNEVIIPAVNGTTGILQSALKYGTSVKRIVVTSSCAAIHTVQDIPHEFSEVDWNEDAVNRVKDEGRNADQLSKYCASKVFAERAVWDFAEKNKGRLPWDIVVINPPWIFGPVIHEVSGVEALNASMKTWWNVVFTHTQEGQTMSEKDLSQTGGVFCDVRDVARSHVLALQKEQARNERIIVASEPFKWQDWINATRKLGIIVSAGNASYDAATTIHNKKFNTTKAARLLQHAGYYSIEETTRDIIADFKRRAWLEA